MPEPSASRLTIYTSNRLDRLVARLAAEASAAPLPPLEREVVVVQSEGMQRWLILTLARSEGIAASLTTPFPRPFCRWLARRILDGEAVPPSESIPRDDDSSFGRQALAWRIFGLLGDLDGSPVLRESAPAVYLSADGDQRKRFQLAQRLGSLFDDYQMFRPDLLAAWLDGGPDPDGAESGLTEIWQAELWRRLVSGCPDGDEPFSDRLERLTRRLATARSEPVGLPRRLWVLGVSTLPPAFVELLAALARWRPVGVLFVSPTYHYWGDLRSDREQARLVRTMRLDRRTGAETQHLDRGNALLAALGRQGREFFNLLQDVDPSGAAWHELDFIDPTDERRSGLSVLARLQSDVLHLVDRDDARGPGAVPWPVPASGRDESLEVHACHAPMREMEVLKDRLLNAFAADEGLRPSDVLVLVPDIELYGPYVQAVFGAQGEGVPPIPFSIADRRAGKEQPPSETILDVLGLVHARATVREVFDLLDTPAVRRRFGLEAADLDDLRRLAGETRIRWGFDGRHRHLAFDVPLVEQNTWRAGLDRLIMGYATGGAEELVGGEVLPFAGDTAGAVEVLGRFARFVSVVSSVVDHLRRPRSFGDWAGALLQTLDRLFAAESDDEENGLQAIRDAADELRRIARSASPVGSDPPSARSPRSSAGSAGASPAASEPRTAEDIHLQVIREHLGAVLSAEGFASGFLAGRVTFCALRPMRTIPFRVIAIAGLDDGAFPRRDRRPGFDLMARSRRPGDRSLRDDDRYLFLETLLAARSRLILTYVGFSQHDNARREPSVVLAELLDQIDRTFICADGGPARRHIVVEHRLQAWSSAYFDPSGGGAVPPSFDRAQCRAALALRHSGEPVPAFAPAALPRGAGEDEGEMELTVDDLVRFWCHPPRAFCQQLGLALHDDVDLAAEDDAEPFEVGGLESYAVRQWLLERRLLSGGELDDAAVERAILHARGLLPPGELGDAAWHQLRRRVDAFRRRLPDEPRLDPVAVDVRGGESVGVRWRLTGRIGELTASGLLRYRCAAVRPADLVRTWIEMLSLAASGAVGVPRCGAILLGEDTEVRMEPPGPGPREAAARLDPLVDGYLQGLRRPLPLVGETSRRWAEQARALADPRSRKTQTPREAARQAFVGRFASDARRAGEGPEPEGRDPYVRQCFRDLDLLDHPEAGRWAERLWWPIFEHAREAS